MQNIDYQLKTLVDLFNKGEKQKALNEINSLLSNNKKNIDLLLLHAKICINLNEIKKSNSSLKKILLRRFSILRIDTPSKEVVCPLGCLLEMSFKFLIRKERVAIS